MRMGAVMVRFGSNPYLTPARTGLIMIALLLLGVIIGRVIAELGHSDVRNTPPARMEAELSGYWCRRPAWVAAVQLAGLQRCVHHAADARERYLIVACTVITDVPEAVGP